MRRGVSLLGQNPDYEFAQNFFKLSTLVTSALVSMDTEKKGKGKMREREKKKENSPSLRKVRF